MDSADAPRRGAFGTFRAHTAAIARCDAPSSLGSVASTKIAALRRRNDHNNDCGESHATRKEQNASAHALLTAGHHLVGHRGKRRFFSSPAGPLSYEPSAVCGRLACASRSQPPSSRGPSVGLPRVFSLKLIKTGESQRAFPLFFVAILLRAAFSRAVAENAPRTSDVAHERSAAYPHPTAHRPLPSAP